MSSIQTINPYTQNEVWSIDIENNQILKKKLDSANSLFNEWQFVSHNIRNNQLVFLIDLLNNNRLAYAKTITYAMGKPLQESLAEIDKCKDLCMNYYNNWSSAFAPKHIDSAAQLSYEIHRPLGTILGIMPWNFPFWQVFRFALPTMLAGNVVVVKHASNVGCCAVLLSEIFNQAQWPYINLAITARQANELIKDPVIRGVSLTGSTAAGREVAASCGAALKPCLLELGGNDAYIVLPDASIDQAVAACVAGRFLNSGQSCIAAKRWIVCAEVYDEFKAKAIEAIDALTIGDPMEEETNIGPMARVDLKMELLEQVDQAIQEGAVLSHGTLRRDDSAFFNPILLEINACNPMYMEELFGPVACLTKATDKEEAIRLANDSPFGLGGAVFTSDLKEGQRIAEQDLDCGAAFVNGFVRSDPRLAFGGIKDSGFGRELGQVGLTSFTNLKTIYVAE